MVKLGLGLLFLIIFTLNTRATAFAIYDPLSVKNNIVGVHILFPDEIFQAEDLINSTGGDWGYVTIPIQSYDKDLIKWQNFMDEARREHVIPILRLATNGDYFNTTVWEKPKYENIIDFANFLDSLSWPTKNRYVVIYNEVNRSDEWGGDLNPSEYAEVLNFAADTFHAKNPDFFVLSAGLDNAAPNQTGKYMNEFTFMRQMNTEIPGIFDKIDGLASHSYPNPGFIQTPDSINMYSFKQERILAKILSGKDLPVFITETGWDKEKLSDFQVASYFTQALQSTWKDPQIVAVTPFILRADSQPFSKFNLLDTQSYSAILSFSKVRGEPQLTAATLNDDVKTVKLPIKNFANPINLEAGLSELRKFGGFFKWLLKI